MDYLEKKNSILVTEFDRYVMEHQDLAVMIPKNAQIVLQVEGDAEYNQWSKRLAEEQREDGYPIVYVRIKGLKPIHSRLVEPVVCQSASKWSQV